MVTNHHQSRLNAFIHDQKNHRIPISLWRHWPIADLHSELVAKELLHFQDTYNFDLIKFSPCSNMINAGFGLVRPWGGKDTGSYERTDGFMQSKTTRDLISMPYNMALLNESKFALQKIIQHYKNKQIPIIYTILSPLYHIYHLYGEKFSKQINEIEPVIKRISDILNAHIQEAVQLGVDGIYYSANYASHQYFTPVEYEYLWNKYEIPILDTARNLEFNCIHYHCEQPILEILPTVPDIKLVSFNSYSDIYETIALAEEYQKIFMGGVNNAIKISSSSNIAAEVSNLLDTLKNHQFILASDCVIPIATPVANINEFIQAVHRVGHSVRKS